MARKLTYFLVFAWNEHGHEIRETEFRCLMDLFLPPDRKHDYTFDWYGGQSYNNAFAYVHTEHIDALLKVASRIILLKEIYQLLSHGETSELCADAVVGTSTELVQKLVQGGNSFSLVVRAFGCKLKNEQQELIRRDFINKMNIEAPVCLSHPNVSLTVWLNAPHHAQSDFKPHCWLGLHIASCTAGCAIANSFSLKKRPFLSTTAMPATYSCIMANCAHVSSGSLTWDPFCGSASIMLICARFGAETIGSDIDYRVLHGGRCNSKQKGSKEANLMENFNFYKLPRPVMLLHADIGHLPLRASMQVDAIVCDPPYGVRAGIMCGGTGDNTDGGTEDKTDYGNRNIGHQGTSVQGLDDILTTFLDASAFHLRRFGRLVFWQPTSNIEDCSDIPSHPAFDVLHAPSQMVHKDIWSRRLVVMVKVREYEAGMVANVKPATVAASHFKKAERSDSVVGKQSKKAKKSDSV
jgi:tRNA (guanine10-N2)-methyltransferase